MIKFNQRDLKQISLLTITEVRLFFRSSLGPFVLFLFLLVTGVIYLNLVLTYIHRFQDVVSTEIPPTAFLDQVLFRFFGYLNFLFLFFIPLISMNTFADQKQKNLVSLYLLNGVSLKKLIWSKWLSVLLISLFILLSTLIFPFLMYSVGFEEFSLIGSSYLGIFYNICLYSMIGIFCSAVFKVSFVSGLSSIMLILFFWMLSWISRSIDNLLISSFLEKFSMLTYFENIARGVIQLSQFSYFLAFVTIFYLLTKTKLEKSRL